MSVNSRIKERRESLNMSRIELAEKIGVTASAVANYENEISSPKIEVMYKIFDALKCDANYLYQDEMESSYPLKVSYKEYEHIEKYRYISEYSPEGAHMVNSVLDREYSIAEQLKQQKECIQELESTPATVIDIQPRLENNTRLIEYHHSASAGTGVFILGNETADQLTIPNTPENCKVDYAIKVSGNSMEPDYRDGDIVLVSQKVEMNIGDVGIFIINNDAYIKEYGETELISRNPEADNITIAEYDNIVCMGKVIGKYKV